MNNNKYDIAFWAHTNASIERCLPLMVSLSKHNIKPLLFYQNYDYRDGLSKAQMEIVKRFDLDVLDYSFILGRNLSLKVMSLFVKFFKAVNFTTLFNKCVGLRSKIIERHMTEDAIKDLLKRLSPKIGFFDCLPLMEYRSYPYGSYYIRRLSEKLGTKSFDLFYGLPYPPRKLLKRDLDYDRYYVPHKHEKEKYLIEHIHEQDDVLAIGDPRFDINWRNTINDVFSKHVKENINRMNVAGKEKIL